MYLAGILALWALLHAPLSGNVRGGPSPFMMADACSIRQSSSGQEPAKPQPPAEPAQSQNQSNPATGQNPQEPEQPQENPKPPEKPAPPAIETPEKKTPGTPGTTVPHKHTKKKPPSTASEEQKKKVISHGSTTEPITVLAPGMTDEQAARQRAATNQLLASTDASLQRISTRNLNKDQQDTVVQIRKFMQQVKAAEATGDLQRAYKLAVKAHLLADALEKS
jgi:outer membrane biosynthesis protein TonB